MSLSIRLTCIGRLKESYYIEACNEYQKRLTRYANLEILELPETGNISKDGDVLLSKISPSDYVIAMCIEGKEYSSPALAGLISDCALRGKSRLIFCIGGSDGLSDGVKARADVRLSMSPMTFPHHLARVMVLEQIYRAFQINEGGKYHK